VEVGNTGRKEQKKTVTGKKGKTEGGNELLVFQKGKKKRSDKLGGNKRKGELKAATPTWDGPGEKQIPKKPKEEKKGDTWKGEGGGARPERSAYYKQTKQRKGTPKGKKKESQSSNTPHEERSGACIVCSKRGKKEGTVTGESNFRECEKTFQTRPSTNRRKFPKQKKGSQTESRRADRR